MRILPVLDLMHGQVVRGVGGRRHEYTPISSSLVSTANPFEVAGAIRERFHLHELYVADLDAIAGGPPAMDILNGLQAEGFTLTVDAGLRTSADAAPLLSAGFQTLVAGLETLAGPHVLRELVVVVGSSKLLFSLDLKEGKPIASAEWPSADPWTIGQRAIQLGVNRLLVLDLARVGAGTGTGTEDLLMRIKCQYPNIELFAGGGVRGRQDLDRMRRSGVDAVLIASALHDGSLSHSDLAHL